MRPDRKPLLDRLEIATPCSADWAAMKGDDRVRFCGLCRLNVYNLSGMPRAEAEALVQKAEGRVCVRFWKREDGTVLTQDCPLGVRVARRVRRAVGVVTATVAGLVGLGGLAWARTSDGTRPRPPVALPHPPIAQPYQGGICPVDEPVMGKVAVAPRNGGEDRDLDKR